MSDNLPETTRYTVNDLMKDLEGWEDRGDAVLFFLPKGQSPVPVKAIGYVDNERIYLLGQE
jgi:hypothetical protein